MKYVSSFEPTLIYVMRINDPAHEGCLKIGKASVNYEEASSLQPAPNSNILNQAAKKRINEYTQTAGIAYDLLYTESTLYFSEKRIKAFLDHDVHEVLERSGIKKKVFNTEAKADEWYITDLETVKKAITAVKQGRRSLNASEITQGQSPIVFRPEQKEAIAKTEKQFKKSNRMLWNAKMRFGKTLSALQVVKDMNFVRTLILTHRPVVNDGWFDDFKKIFYDRDDFFYGSKNKGNTFDYVERLVQQRIGHYVYFASLQDLRGSELVGGKFDKNDEIFGVNWDLVIIDEAHEGTQTELGKSVLKELEKDNTKILQLSGTPFNLLDEHTGDAIYTWDYVMEQKAKRDWDILHKGDPNPYASLPHLNIFTFDLGKMLGKYQDEELAFNFHEFFRVDVGVNISTEDILKSFYFADSDLAAQMDARLKDIVDGLHKLNPTASNYKNDLMNKVNSMVSIIPQQNKVDITRYVARRKLVLDVFEKALDRELSVQQDGNRNIDEKILHNILFQQSSEDTLNSDLWLLNEDFIYFNGTSEERLFNIKLDGENIFRDEFSAIETEYLCSLGEDRRKKRPDVLLFPAEGKCIIVEFKNPSVNVSDYLSQINKYATWLGMYTKPQFDFATFYGYLIGESIEKIDIKAADANFKESYHFKYFFRPSCNIFRGESKPDGNLYMEIIKYSVLLERAKTRNKIFIDKLTQRSKGQDIADIKQLSYAEEEKEQLKLDLE